jgi:hypothetical protein
MGSVLWIVLFVSHASWRKSRRNAWLGGNGLRRAERYIGSLNGRITGDRVIGLFENAIASPFASVAARRLADGSAMAVGRWVSRSRCAMLTLFFLCCLRAALFGNGLRQSGIIGSSEDRIIGSTGQGGRSVHGFIGSFETSTKRRLRRKIVGWDGRHLRSFMLPVAGLFGNGLRQSGVIGSSEDRIIGSTGQGGRSVD